MYDLSRDDTVLIGGISVFSKVNREKLMQYVHTCTPFSVCTHYNTYESRRKLYKNVDALFSGYFGMAVL